MIVSYKACFGLYIYLRQLELSLDRALSEDISGIKKYFAATGIYKPREIIVYFEKFIQMGGVSERKSLRSILLFWKIYKNKSFVDIPKNDLLTVLKCIKDSCIAINSEVLDVEKFALARLALSTVAEQVFSNKIRRNDRRKAIFVEHYNQSQYLSFKSIDAIIGEKWISL